jgi:uncharacterized protein YfdQ (DUF2303 family)
MSTEAEAVAKLVIKPTSHFVRSEDGREFLAVPKDHEFREVTLPHALPVYEAPYISQQLLLQTTDSLVEYCLRYKGENTILFADIETDTIVAQIDYHAPDKAAHAAHRGTLKLSRSIEWTEWNKISGKLMEQLDFARFIEENAADIRAPQGADLLECIRDIQAHRKVDFSKAVRTASNNESFHWSEETKAGTKTGGIEIPTKFELGIPVYFGEPDTQVFAFLRWALDVPSLKLGIVLHRAEHVRQAAFKQIVTQISERTDCLAVFGKI